MSWQPRMEGVLSILGLDVSWDCEAEKWEEEILNTESLVGT